MNELVENDKDCLISHFLCWPVTFGSLVHWFILAGLKPGSCHCQVASGELKPATTGAVENWGLVARYAITTENISVQYMYCEVQDKNKNKIASSLLLVHCDILFLQLVLQLGNCARHTESLEITRCVLE